MRNILLVARREFLATVATPAYVIGLLVFPALILVGAVIGPRLFNPRDFQVKGEVRVIDRSGQVMAELKNIFDARQIAARRKKDAPGSAEEVSRRIRQSSTSAVDANFGNFLGPIPEIRILDRPPEADIEREKDWLLPGSKGPKRLALVVIHANAAVPDSATGEYGTYDLYIPPNLDDRASTEIQRGLREAIVNIRLRARSIDRETIDALTRIPPVESVTVARDQERQTVRGLNMLLPVAFLMLLFIGVMGGGGQLLTTTVEEKSSRVVEVLLSAVSPMELMAGKLAGQMAASLIGMVVYVIMGVALLASFALFGMLDLSLIFYLLIFFFIAYFVMGSLMMAVGAAVNDMKEAQSLMAPLTILFVIPWILWMPISMNPSSALSVVLSFLPPINTFAMLLRMASNTPPPGWQVWLSIAIGIASVLGSVWFAAKVFRIGLLMHGKPPNLATLIRWVRAA